MSAVTLDVRAIHREHNSRHPQQPGSPVETYTPAELELMRVLQRYKTENHRLYPRFTEVLACVVALGYRQVAPPGPLRSIGDAFPQEAAPRFPASIPIAIRHTKRQRPN